MDHLEGNKDAGDSVEVATELPQSTAISSKCCLLGQIKLMLN